MKTFICSLSGKSKFGQKSDRDSKYTNMEIHTHPAILANCQKALILSDYRSLHKEKMNLFVNNLA